MVRLMLDFYRLQHFWGHIKANTGDQSYQVTPGQFLNMKFGFLIGISTQ